jgi:hypothetical protein
MYSYYAPLWKLNVQFYNVIFLQLIKYLLFELLLILLPAKVNLCTMPLFQRWKYNFVTCFVSNGTLIKFLRPTINSRENKFMYYARMEIHCIMLFLILLSHASYVSTDAKSSTVYYLPAIVMLIFCQMIKLLVKMLLLIFLYYASLCLKYIW